MNTGPLARLLAVTTLGAATLVAGPLAARADGTPASIPFSQDWSNPDLITVNDDWSGVPSIVGYRGDELTAATGADPQLVVTDGSTSPVDVIAGSTAASNTGGVHELPGAVGLQGSGTADVPHLVVRLDATGAAGITVAYDLVDVDTGADRDPANVQQVALQYRVGGSGGYTNVPSAYVADASSTLGTVTPVAATLPAAADGQAVVEVRVLTTNAVGNDTMIAVDNLSITAGGGPVDPPPPPPPPVLTVGAVQGSGSVTPVAGQTVTVDGIVTTLLTSQDAPDGFFLQDEGDGDPATSDGIYVFCRGACTAVTTGDAVTVTGTATEFFAMTQIDARTGTTVVTSSGNPLPTATPVNLPASGSTRAADTFETTEGMVVTIPQTLVVSEYFQLARYGEIVLTEGARPDQFTDTNAPDPAGYAAFLADLATRRIILDDDNNDQNDAVTGITDEPYPWPSGGLAVDNRIRGGDTITGLTGVLHWSFAGQTGTDAWRIRPIAGVDHGFTSVNPAPALAEVGGDVRVASFNVLNYFTTIDTTSSSSTGPCGPSGTLDCRGADSAAELVQQRTKIVAALDEIDADVVGLIEIQNDAASVADLLTALNAAPNGGTYAEIATGSIGTDAIKVALVYQADAVTPVGTYAILDTSVDPRFLDDKNRPVLVQTFEENATGERFTVAVNHLKSKGSACTDVGDPDLLDGAGNCNVTRTQATAALADFLATDPTGSGDDDVLIIGDLNSYRLESPITTLTAAGYTDLVAEFEGDDAYSYVFDGQLGYLDHALANASLAPQVTGVTTWHVNADEVPLFDYNDAVRDTPGEAAFERESAAIDLTDPSARRSSDHDPLVVGLDLGPDDQPLRLTLLHNNDGESALLPSTNIGGVARFATIVERLRDEAAAEPGNADSLLVSSGDNYLAGPQLQASLDNYDGDTDYSDDGPFYDALALDRLQYDASAVGNHEFDFGPGVLGYFISQFDTSNIRFVSANLDVTGEAALAAFVDTPPGAPGTLVEWTRVEAGGQSVAVVGATTPRLASISSPGPDVTADDDVRGAVQDAIAAATADGTDIVILLSHLQNIAEDQALIAELTGLDIAVAGGGDELLANADDALLPGTAASAIFGPYPLVAEAADGTDVPIVTTQGSYGYVGRLIVDIDVDGNVVAVDDRSGPVRNPFDATAPPADQAEPDPWVLANVEAPVAEYVAGLQGEVIAFTEPALDGVTANVRSRETNLGSFFADALRESAELAAPGVFGATNPTVAIQNSGGIRNSLVLGPNEDVTTFDTFQIAPFSNFIAYLTDVSPEQLKELMERSVSANTTAGALQPEGRFGQISGMNLVYDPLRTAQAVVRNPDGTVTVTTPGERVRQLTLTLNDDDPSNDIVVVRNGVVVAGAPNVDLASNSFTIRNGDNYPFNVAEGEFVNLPETYQQSLEAKFRREGTVTAAEYPEGGLGRITVGGDVPVEQVLRVDAATLFFPPRRAGGTATIAGGIDATLDRCPQLELTVDGAEVISVRTFPLLSLCIGISAQGFAVFDLGSSDVDVVATLPRGFEPADAEVDLALDVDGSVYAASVTGRLRGKTWRYPA